jgi:transposase InsO family protein
VSRPLGTSATQLAEQLGIPRSTLYYQSKLALKDEQLRQDIHRVLHLHPSYGHRRLAIALGVNKKRVLRVMHRFDIKPYRRRGKKPAYTKTPSMADAILPNLTVDYFPVAEGEVWASDFTYVPFKGKFIYLATLLDVFSRQVVGWQISDRHDTALVASALYDALERHGRPKILHSDRGSEYLSQAYRELATNCGIELSYSAKANPWQNGYQESFYQGFKVDLGDPSRFEDTGQLIESIHLQLYIYNNYRIHLSLKMAPKQYLAKQQAQAVVPAAALACR